MAHGRRVALALAALVMAYGALLRFDAVTLSYGPFDRPAWLHALQQSRLATAALRPAALTWSRVPLSPHADGHPTAYISDPYTYLQYAREMRRFYAAHRREPVFPFVTKVFLGLLDQQDVAVSAASASFSVLAIALTFLLGAFAFSPWVGLGAALGLAIEYDDISWGIGGWRDDAFTCAVLLSVYTTLRYLRAPSGRRAVWVGLAAGAACLVRITSLSFLIPEFILLVVLAVIRGAPESRRLRAAELALAAGTFAIVAAPFLINCWLVFGDPLYSINVHADVYRTAQGQVTTGQSAAQYVWSGLRQRPVQMIDTVVRGMTSYPFQNKWQGFDPWGHWVGTWLSWASIAGLFLFLGSAPGRVMLVVVGASIAPYSVTWKLVSDWRFTEHVYPFLLLASAYAIVSVVSLAAPSRLRALARAAADRRQVAFWAAGAAAVALAVFVVTRRLPILVDKESLASGDIVMIAGEPASALFFDGDWAEWLPSVNTPMRVSRGPRAGLWLPLAAVRDYDVTVRLNPFPAPAEGTPPPLPLMHVFLNNAPVAAFQLGWNPGRVGAYQVHLPQAAVGRRDNHLVFVASSTDGGAAAFALWYVRIRPGT